MDKPNIVIDEVSTTNFYAELMHNVNCDGMQSRLHAASMIIERCGDIEMADTLGLLCAQLDFDDNAEACDAIERTRAKLDAMIADRKIRGSNHYIKVLRDSEVLELSNGEVTGHDYDYLSSSFCKNGLFDPSIFGGSGRIPLYDDANDKFDTSTYGHAIGHIKLPVRVMLRREYLYVAHLLGLSEENVRKVAQHICYLVLDPGQSDFKKFDVVDEQVYSAQVNSGVVFTAATGADALYEALKSLNHGDEPERLAFSVLPVVSPVVRPVAYSLAEQHFYTSPLNDCYSTIVHRVSRLSKLIECGAPSVILKNESRMLDELVNRLADAAYEIIQHTHCRKPSYHSFMRAQLGLILRRRNFSLHRLSEQELGKTCDIESLNIFPTTIRLMDNGEVRECALADIIHHNDGVVTEYENAHSMEYATDVDSADLDTTTRDRIAQLSVKIERLSSYNNHILAKARSEHEKCTVEFNEADGMYSIV